MVVLNKNIQVVSFKVYNSSGPSHFLRLRLLFFSLPRCLLWFMLGFPSARSSVACFIFKIPFQLENHVITQNQPILQPNQAPHDQQINGRLPAPSISGSAGAARRGSCEFPTGSSWRRVCDGVCIACSLFILILIIYCIARTWMLWNPRIGEFRNVPNKFYQP